MCRIIPPNYFIRTHSSGGWVGSGVRFHAVCLERVFLKMFYSDSEVTKAVEQSRDNDTFRVEQIDALEGSADGET